MADAVVTRAAAGDVPALRALWVSAFGDPPELIDAFFCPLSAGDVRLGRPPRPGDLFRRLSSDRKPSRPGAARAARRLCLCRGEP